MLWNMSARKTNKIALTWGIDMHHRLGLVLPIVALGANAQWLNYPNPRIQGLKMALGALVRPRLNGNRIFRRLASRFAKRTVRT